MSIRRYTVDEYHRMIEAGILTEDDRVELLEGWLVPTMRRTPIHDNTLHVAAEYLRERLPTGWRVRILSAVTLPDSEPEPDVAVAQGPIPRFMPRHPRPPEVPLVVEVADSSLARDRNDKVRIYARAGIPVYWIINLVDAQVEVYTAPSGPTATPAYGQHQDYRPGDQLPLLLDGRQVGQIAARDLLP